MLYFTGDTHGNFSSLSQRILGIPSRQTSTLIICGDFGFIWNGSQGEQEMLDRLNAYGIQLLFVDGNHENFQLLEQFSQEQWCGGMTHRIRSNIRHLMRGQVFEIAHKKVFTFGGGVSADKRNRVPMVSWWPQENPSTRDYQRAETVLSQHEQIDYIVSHVPPLEAYQSLQLKPAGDAAIAGYLQRIRRKYPAAIWCCGHLHLDQWATHNTLILEKTVFSQNPQEISTAANRR